MPLIRRVPKRGFHNLFRKEFAIVNVGRLEKLEGDVSARRSCSQSGVISNLRDGLKILGDGELKRAVKVSAHRVSKSAREKIEAAGGTVELLADSAPVRAKAAKTAPAEGAGSSEAPPAKAAATKSKKATPPAAAKAAKPKAAPKKAAESKPAKTKAEGKAPKGKGGGEGRKK